MSESMPDATTSVARAVGAIAACLHPDRIGTGALAALRRLDPAALPAEPALHRLLAEYQPDAATFPTTLRNWTLIVHALALAAPDALQARGTDRGGLGRPLFEAKFSEMRMTQLLEARREDLPRVVPRAVRFLVAHGGKLDPVSLAYFVLDLASGDPARAERQRVRVASDYYAAERAARATQATEEQP